MRLFIDTYKFYNFLFSIIYLFITTLTGSLIASQFIPTFSKLDFFIKIKKKHHIIIKISCTNNH